MAPLLAQILAVICFVLGLLHIYWAFNGQWGRGAVIPTKDDGNLLFEIGPFSCILVALVLVGLSFFYQRYFATYLIVVDSYARSAFYSYGLLTITMGFVLRAIGDFKYVGFFKSVRNTQFGRLDSKYFSPLCLVLGLASLALYFLTH